MAKIGIVGTGIAGMASAYMLQKAGHDIVVFEQNDYIGGHTHTVEVDDHNKLVPIDTGFIVFNETNYPNLVQLFTQLGVEYQDTDMSFAVTNPYLDLEYCGSTLNSLFCQRRNIIRPKFYRLLQEIIKFNKVSPEVLYDVKYRNYSIKDYFEYRRIGKLCFEQYLVPMSVALWSAPSETIQNFPIVSLVKFFKNHGLLGFTTQLQWKTVKGGSFTYRDLLIETFKDKIQLNSKVENVKRVSEGVVIGVNGTEHFFDKVVMASHADQSYNLLHRPTDIENKLLSKFKYQKNIVDLHTDKKVMPVRKNGWAAWNHAVTNQGTYVSYWMNKLQNLETWQNYFVSLNATEYIANESILQSFTYHHPIFDLDAMNAQKELHLLNSSDGDIFFCGSYFGHGFHEDAMTSAVDMCRKILGKEEVL